MSKVPFYYRLLLRFFPSRFRREFGADMQQFYVDRLREARSSGRRGAVLSEWSHAAMDSARYGVSERAAVLRGSLLLRRFKVNYKSMGPWGTRVRKSTGGRPEFFRLLEMRRNGD